MGRKGYNDPLITVRRLAACLRRALLRPGQAVCDSPNSPQATYDALRAGCSSWAAPCRPCSSCHFFTASVCCPCAQVVKLSGILQAFSGPARAPQASTACFDLPSNEAGSGRTAACPACVTSNTAPGSPLSQKVAQPALAALFVHVLRVLQLKKARCPPHSRPAIPFHSMPCNSFHSMPCRRAAC